MAFSQGERDRLRELHGVLSGQLKQREAARRLGLSVRQVRRLCRRVKRMGDTGVIHGLRGRVSNRRIDPKIQRKALALLATEVYRGFGPTLAAEHLCRSGIANVGRETTRKWMSGAGLWRPKVQKVEQVHTWRPRRESFGELVQMDTSDHDWLEGRGPRFKIIGMIDDATSRVIARFVDEDSSQENLKTLKEWLERYGRPLALYTDKSSLFVTAPSLVQEQIQGKPLTNIGQALLELGIEWIPANSPAAKGRVERLFGTFQDRLVKELRVAKVKSLEEANRFLELSFLPQWEEQFTKPAANPADAHRPLRDFDLDSVLCLREERTVASDYTLQIRGQKFGISKKNVRPGLRHARVIVEHRLDGSLWARFRKHRIPLAELPVSPAITPSGLRPPGAIAKTKPYWTPKSRPRPDHPWRTLLLGRKGDISTLR